MKKELSLGDKAIAALRDAVSRVIERHRRTGQPLAVWKDEKVVHIAPPPSSVREEGARYGRERGK